jgi:hypothetical protein
MWMDQDQSIVVFALVSPLAEGCLKLNYTDWKLLEPKTFASYVRALPFVPYHVLCIAANGWRQFLDTAVGLQSLHKHGVVHGDIRPVCQKFLCCSSDSLFFIL